MTFKKFLLLEGGNAFPNSSNIEQENVLSTLKEYEKQILKPIFKLDLTKVSLLGSALKKTTPSGDLDIAMPEGKLKDTFDIFDDRAFLNKISEVLPIDSKINYGGKQVYTLFPQYDKSGEKTNKLVQIDLMFGEVEYLKYSYHAPKSEESKYKGVYRNILLATIARETKSDVVKDETGKEISRVRYVFNLNKGLLKVLETLKVKNFQKGEREFITNNPDEIAKILLGKSFTREDTMSFEKLWDAIHKNNFIGRKNLKSIIDEFKESLLENKLEIPKEIV